MKFLSSKTIATALLATGVVTGGMVSAANAAAFSTATCDITDITDLNDAAAADACAGGFAGNDSEGDAWSTQLNDNDVFGDYNWTNLYDIDGDGDAYDLTDYKIDSADGANDLFRISYSEGKIEFNQDIDVQFALVLKAGNFWSAYSFDGVTADEIFEFDTKGVAVHKNNGGSPGLSHASIYFSDNSITSDPQEVPEPTVIGGLLMVGAGLAASRHRRVK